MLLLLVELRVATIAVTTKRFHMYENYIWVLLSLKSLDLQRQLQTLTRTIMVMSRTNIDTTTTICTGTTAVTTASNFINYKLRTATFTTIFDNCYYFIIRVLQLSQLKTTTPPTTATTTETTQ